MRNLTLSIITVNLNNNAGLIKTLKSIKEQTFNSYEHIIIDGGSADGSLDTIRNYAHASSHLAYWSSEPDKGIYDGMNKGIQKAKGEYLYFLNSGDCLQNGILAQIPFDGTQYIYGDARLVNPGKGTERIYTYPEVPDFVYLSNNSLQHQACFIHRDLFAHKRYDIAYKIVADWAHTFQSIVLERCSYKHLPYVVATCDACGTSADNAALRAERERWFRSELPPVLSNGLLSCTVLDESKLRDVLPLICRTRRFKKRIKKLVTVLCRLNNLLSGASWRRL